MTAINSNDMDLNSAAIAGLMYVIADIDERIPR
jgi:hypothetical protein